jgi:hypothetical protein
MKDRFGFDESRVSKTQFWKRPTVHRRLFFRHMLSGTAGYFLLPTLVTERVAHAKVTPKGTAKQCIFILMRGGPSHIDTFDLKEGAWMPAELQPTTYGNIRWPRGLMPKIAEHLDSVSLVRSVQAWAAVHVLAQVWVQIGRNPVAASSKIAPAIGSVVSMELGSKDAALPAYVSLNQGSGIGAGYLPPLHNPFFMTPGGGGLANTRHGDGNVRFDRRYGLLLSMDSELRSQAPLGGGPGQTEAYNLAARNMVYNDVIDRVFTFDAAERARYGTSQFGNACIAARNMLRNKTGVKFIQIDQGSWDQHDNIYAPTNSHMTLGKQFDDGLGALLTDLKADGAFEETLIVCMGEFGRTVGALTATRGRDHLRQQAILVAGGGVRGNHVVGSTNAAGSATLDPGWSRARDIRAEDVEATMYSALGIDWTTIRRDDPLGRGFYYVPESDRDVYGPINELWG